MNFDLSKRIEQDPGLVGAPEGQRMLIFDHAPRPGPQYWDWRCLACSQRVDDHAGWLARWRWRRLNRKR